MTRFQVLDTSIAGLRLIDRQVRSDQRGFLTRLFCAEDLAGAGWTKPIAQLNYTFTSAQGAVRGFHYQTAPFAEMKLVTCIRGEVWDVAIDLRCGSPTFLQWHAEVLSASNYRAMLIPEGFAHGFQVLSAGAELIYCHSAPYNPAAEAGINPLDASISIAWPQPITELSDRDAGHPHLTSTFAGLYL